MLKLYLTIPKEAESPDSMTLSSKQAIKFTTGMGALDLLREIFAGVTIDTFGAKITVQPKLVGARRLGSIASPRTPGRQ